MDISRLQEFITLASLLNYSKAASQLYVTQPALSRHIHDLENTIGAPLFIRDTHSVHLTSVGELFYGEAKSILERYNHALLLVKDAASNTSGELKIGFLGTASQNFFSDFVIAFTASHPEISLTFNCGTIDVLANQLLEGDTDVGVVSSNLQAPAGLESMVVRTFPLFAVMHPDHVYAAAETVSLTELSDFPCINFSAQNNPMAADYNKQLFKKAGARCNIVEEVTVIEEGIFQASINKGFFLLPDYLLCMIPETMKAVPLAEEFCTISLNVFWKKSNPNPSLPQFINEFRTYIRNHDELH